MSMSAPSPQGRRRQAAARCPVIGDDADLRMRPLDPTISANYAGRMQYDAPSPDLIDSHTAIEFAVELAEFAAAFDAMRRLNAVFEAVKIAAP
jgi:hypothetical protein